MQPGAGGAEFTVPPWMWAAFVAAIVGLLVVDLKVVHSGDQERIPTRDAAIYSGVWIALGVGFGGVMWAWQGGTVAVEYLTGYAIEKSLSIDNVFLWSVIFGYFAVPERYQYRVLFWGIFGALAFRAAFIFAGVAALDAVGWLTYVFGAFLLITAVRIATKSDEDVDPERNPVLRLFRRAVPMTDDFRENSFFVRAGAGLKATPLAAVLVVIETTDVVFAVDSIPAVLAVTRNEFIVFSSNAFAVLGLRALYFLLAGMRERFRYLKQGLGVILGFVGLKFLIEDLVHIPTFASLGFILLVLGGTIGLSWWVDRRERRSSPEPERTSSSR